MTELSNDKDWTHVTYKSQKNNVAKTWRQRLNILRGTAVSENEGESLSADVHLVAYGLAKNVSGIQLSKWLADKGLQVLTCDLLTKYEGARSLSFKFTVRSCDYEKAISPDIWPFGVGVRLFKFFSDRRDKNGDGRTNSAPQARLSRQNNNRTSPSDNSRRSNTITRSSWHNPGQQFSENLLRNKNNSQTENCLDQSGTVRRQPWLPHMQHILPHNQQIQPSTMQQMQPPKHQIQPAIQQFQLPVDQLPPPTQEMLPRMRNISQTQYDNPLKEQGSLTNIPMHVRFQDQRLRFTDDIYV